MRERTGETLKNSSQKGPRAAISIRVPATYPHNRPPTRGHTQKWRQLVAEREKHTVLVLRMIRTRCTRFLFGCQGGRSSSQCPACGVSCQVVSTYHSIPPTLTVTYFVLRKRSARMRMRASVNRDETFAESDDMRKGRYFLLMFSSDMFWVIFTWNV